MKLLTVLVIVALPSQDVRVTYVPDREGQTIPVALACDEIMLRVPKAIAIRGDGFPDLPKLKAFIADAHVQKVPRCA